MRRKRPSICCSMPVTGTMELGQGLLLGCIRIDSYHRPFRRVPGSGRAIGFIYAKPFVDAFFFLSFFKNSSPCYVVRGLFPGRRVVAGGDRIRFEVARHTEVCLGGSTPQ